MNKKKIFVICFLIIIIALIVFLSKDFIIRKMLISKLENVSPDEYIVTYINNNRIFQSEYFKAGDKRIVRVYDYEEINDYYNYLEVSDIKNKEVYTYYIDTKEIDGQKNKVDQIDSKFCWNGYILDTLKDENLSFRYLGTEAVDNTKCYKMIFKDGTGWSCTAYVDKNNCVVIKQDFDLSKIIKEDDLKNSEEMGQTINGHIIFDYKWDFELKQKGLFEM